MFSSRREFLHKAAGSAAALSIAPEILSAATTQTAGAQKPDASPETILALFKALPGEYSVKIYAPAANGKPEYLVQSPNSSKMLFVGSAFKSFVLCEALRQADSADVMKKITGEQLTLDASAWSLDSAVFNPPNLIGKVSERTALEAMIMHSDNTATDMCEKYVGADRVREFVASIGLKNTMIPDSTRSFFGYLLGAKNYKMFTWDELCAAIDKPMVNPPLNQVETLASSADDFVSYYSQALAGKFFKNEQTLRVFRQILSMGDAIWLVPLPLGVSAFVKGGSIDVTGHHALCVPGGMLFDDRWVYFCLTLNWPAPAESDPATVQAFAAACSTALTRVKVALSC